MTPCEYCQAPTALVICWNCAKLLRRQLVELPWYLDRLHESAYGEAKTAPRGAVKAATSDTPGLPLNARAAELLRVCRASLTVWWLDVLAGGGAPVPAGEDCARPLANAVGPLMSYAKAGEMLAELIDLRAEAEEVIDLPPDRVLAGLCPAVFRDGPREGERCAVAVYADPGDEAVLCPACGALVVVEELRAEGLAHIYNELRSAADMFRISKWLRRKVSRATFYRIMAHIEAAELTAEGSPLYRWADVEAVLDERERQAAERAAERRRKAADAELLTAQQVAG
ncbi:DNA binding protein [Mycobacterium Phage Nergal]|nr:DNA binding protein [Mycobacterium Phage Nergal]